jgi:putative membrane protein
MLLAAASAATLAACASASMPMPNRGMSPSMAPAMMPVRAMDYARMAAASDLYEIQSSQIALQVSQNPEVRGFAQMLIDHHTHTTATLMAASRAAGMTPPPPMLDARKAQMIQQLRASSGAQFDMAYVMQQVPAHQEALALHSDYAQRGDSPQLRGAAASAVPIVQQHLAQAQGLHSRMMR